jgi:AhpD family alkylhydroperoxidase
MTPRLNYWDVAPKAVQPMLALEDNIKNGLIEHPLVELVKTRVSQINGCAFCLHMHASDLRKLGVDDMKLHLLAGWRESRYFSDRERAALGWAEALTLVSETQAPDAEYEALAAQYTEEERVRLTFAIGAINTWNRIAIGFRFAHPVEAQRAAA